MQAETPSWVFLVSACISKRRRGSSLQRLTVVEQKKLADKRIGIGSVPGPTRRPHNGLSSAVLQTRVQIQLSTNF